MKDVIEVKKEERKENGRGGLKNEGQRERWEGNGGRMKKTKKRGQGRIEPRK